MADQNLEVQQDPKVAAEQDAIAAAAAKKNANGKEAAAGDDHGSDDDIEAIKAENARLKKQYGDILNEKKRHTEDRKKLAETLKAWNSIAEEHQVEPDQIKEILAARDKVEEDQARDKGEVDKLLANQRRKFEAKIAQMEDAIRMLNENVISAKNKTIEALTIDTELENELQQIKVKPSLKRGAFSLHRPKLKIIEDEEAPHGLRVVAQVADSEMSVRDYLKNWAENDPDAWDYLVGNQSAGGGAPPGASRIKGVFKPRSKMTAAEKSAAIDKLGPERYAQLPWS